MTRSLTLCASVAVKVGLEDARAFEPLAAELALETLTLRRLTVNVARRRLWPWLSRLVDYKVENSVSIGYINDTEWAYRDSDQRVRR